MSEDLSKLTNKESILLLHTKVDDLNVHFTNHLHKHWAVLMLTLGVALTSTGSLIVGIILLFVKGILKIG